MVALLRMFYQQFECSIIVDGNLSEWFPVESGVPEGCILSPILFLLAIDWVMQKATVIDLETLSGLSSLNLKT